MGGCVKPQLGFCCCWNFVFSVVFFYCCTCFWKKKKMDRRMGGWGLANLSFSRNCGFFFNLTRPLRHLRWSQIENSHWCPWLVQKYVSIVWVKHHCLTAFIACSLHEQWYKSSQSGGSWTLVRHCINVIKKIVFIGQVLIYTFILGLLWKQNI